MCDYNEYEDIIQLLRMIAPRRHSNPQAVYMQRTSINEALTRLSELGVETAI